MAVVDMESQDSYFQIFSISFYSGVFLKGSARVHLNPRMFLTLVSKLKHDFPHLKCKTSRKIVSSITFSSSILKKIIKKINKKFITRKKRNFGKK